MWKGSDGAKWRLYGKFSSLQYTRNFHQPLISPEKCSVSVKKKKKSYINVVFTLSFSKIASPGPSNIEILEPQLAISKIIDLNMTALV